MKISEHMNAAKALLTIAETHLRKARSKAEKKLEELHGKKKKKNLEAIDLATENASFLCEALADVESAKHFLVVE